MDIPPQAERVQSRAKVFVERFQREIRSLARLQHPSAVAVYDVAVLPQNSTPYMVMELLDGHDLAQELDLKGALPPVRLRA